MRLHREGNIVLLLMATLLLFLVLLLSYLLPMLDWLFALAAIIFYGFVVNFFRHPRRIQPAGPDDVVFAPADGKVVVIEETQVTEFLNGPCIQLSIFMSPLDVHVNRVPISGKVIYRKHHPGSYLVAWHPKASSHNERATTVIEHGEIPILMRQIAGAVARRICTYVDPEQQVQRGDEMGFIKFGSRTDLFLPLGSEILVEVDQHVKAGLDRIARLPGNTGI